MSQEERDRVSPILTPQHLERIALFPLPNAVFFPNTMLPLHIFEPRYREMTRDAVEEGIPIAVMRLKRPKEITTSGMPAFEAIGGAGFLLHHQELPDGRYNILLEGAGRIRVVEELETEHGYRVGRAELLSEDRSNQQIINALMTTLRGCVVGLQAHYQRLSEALARTMNNVQDPGALSDTIASIIISDPDHRQQLLEELRVEARLDEIIGRLTDLLATTHELSPGGTKLD